MLILGSLAQLPQKAVRQFSKQPPSTDFTYSYISNLKIAINFSLSIYTHLPLHLLLTNCVYEPALELRELPLALPSASCFISFGLSILTSLPVNRITNIYVIIRTHKYTNTCMLCTCTNVCAMQLTNAVAKIKYVVTIDLRMVRTIVATNAIILSMKDIEH